MEFSVLSDAKTLKHSVVEVKHARCFDEGVAVADGPFDTRFGIWRGLHDRCPTCKLVGEHCQGHHGHFLLFEAVLHPLFAKYVIKELHNHCAVCLEAFPSKNTCVCGGLFSIETKACVECKVKKTSSKLCPSCDAPRVRWLVEERGLVTPKEPHTDFQTREDVLALLQSIPACAKYLISVLPVPPAVIRPPNVSNGTSIRGQNDLTLGICEIIKITRELNRRRDRGDIEHSIDEVRKRLFSQLAVYYSNSAGAFDFFRKNNSNLEGLIDRLKGKQGRFRKTLMGKRSNFTARTVVSGDACLGIEELGVPYSIAETLTKPVRITDANAAYWNERLFSQPDSIKSIEDSDGNAINLRYVKKSNIELLFGHVIHRTLQDGDWVIFNRQPSLHKQSMMAHKIKLLPFSSFRMNLAATSPYNADFDGDEMNIHVPQTLQADAELVELCRVSSQFISKTRNAPCMGIVQDCLLTAYKATADDSFMSETVWNDAISFLGFEYLSRAQMIEKLRAERHGRDLVSLVLPPDLWYTRGRVVIEDGILKAGQLRKNVLGKSSGGLVHVLVQDRGGLAAADFINRMQDVMRIYMTACGFSVGLSDCLLSNHALGLIADATASAVAEFDTLNAQDDDFEELARAALNKARDQTGKIALKHTEKGNRFVDMTTAGSKGSAVNLSQIMACLGQQNVRNARIQPTLGGRTLPQFEIGDLGPAACGYIKHSYVEGLDPAEFFFHTCAGREGLVDTAVKTANTGYLQRRLVKGLENVQVEYDGTVRDGAKVLQFFYGDDGLDAESIEFQKIDFLQLKADEFEDMFVADSNAEEIRAIREGIAMFEQADMCRDENRRFDRSFPLALPLRRMIDAALRVDDNGMQFGSVNCTFELKPLTRLHKRWASFPPLYQGFLCCTLASKRLVSLGFTEQQLKLLLADIKTRWRRAQVQPGESVGAIAAQGVGEPATQLTLNTFHSSGSGSNNVTSGVPRLTELINCSPNPKTPSSTLYFKENSDLHSLLRKRKDYAPVVLQDLVESVRYGVVDEAPFYSSFELFKDGIDTQSGGLVCTVSLNRKKCFEYCVDVSEIVQRLYKRKKELPVRCIYPEDSDLASKDIYIVVGDSADDDVSLRPCFHSRYAELSDFIKRTLKSTFGGTKGLAGAVVKRKKTKVYKENLFDMTSEWVIETQGSKILQSMQEEDVDALRCVSNSIHDIFNTFGIEATRAALKNEIRAVLQFDGSYLNVRHVGLLADWMTWVGAPTPFTRFGMAKMSDSALKLASFERVQHFVTEAAVNKTHDDCLGVSERLIMGEAVCVGTGKIDCFLDIEACKKAVLAEKEDVWGGDAMGLPFQMNGLPEFTFTVPPPPGMSPCKRPRSNSPTYTQYTAAYRSPTEYNPMDIDEAAYRPTSP